MMLKIDRQLCPDFKLVCKDGAKIRCHLLVLANACELFKTYMQSWDKTKKFKLEFSGAAVTFFISYIYDEDPPKITESDCEELCDLLDYLRANHLGECLTYAVASLGKGNNIPKTVYTMIRRTENVNFGALKFPASKECIMSVMCTIFAEKLYKPAHLGLLSGSGWTRFYQGCTPEIQELIRKESVMGTIISKLEPEDLEELFRSELENLLSGKPSLLVTFRSSFATHVQHADKGRKSLFRALEAFEKN
jgi:hypothetical protein